MKKRSDEAELRLRVRMLNSRHIDDLIQKARDELGSRFDKLGPLDLSRNPLVRYVTVLATAYTTPPGVTGLPAEMVTAIGDSSSSPIRARYAAAGYTPMPTAMRSVSRDAERYLIACHYVGVLVAWSDRWRRPTLSVVTPDCLSVTYDDGPQPVIVRHKVVRQVGGKPVQVEDVYDLTAPTAPTYMVVDAAGKDVTEAAVGDVGYPWRYADGTPFCPVIVYGRAQDLSRGVELVEASLRVSIGWSSWWAAIRDTCFKGRNVRGLSVVSLDTLMAADGSGQGGAGMAVGPEDVVRWADDDPEKPGEHWQWDAPFDAEAIGRAIASYEAQALGQLGVPLDLTATGGEPLAHELEARRLAAQLHYDALRAGDADVLRAAAAILNLKSSPETPYPTAAGSYGVDYHEEVKEILDARTATTTAAAPRAGNGGVPGQQAGSASGAPAAG